MPSFLYLASQSPRRRQLLEQIHVRYELLLPDATEDAEALEAVLPDETPLAYVQRVTHAKAQAAWHRWQKRQLPPAPILCADTTVALGAQILGKPADAEEAQRMLAQLAGQTHHVFTAVAVQCAAQRWAALSVSQVTFAPLTPAQIAAYVASGEPMGKAGAYAIQGPAQQYVRHLAGSYSGIMGLPLYETAALLRQVGWPG